MLEKNLFLMREKKVSEAGPTNFAISTTFVSAVFSKKCHKKHNLATLMSFMTVVW